MKKMWRVKIWCKILLILAVCVVASHTRAQETKGKTGSATKQVPTKKAAGEATEIRMVLDEQEAAWNHGDIDGFMKGYWKSEQTKFVSGSGVNRGWQALLERYKRTYPDRKAMGSLTFSDLEITMLGRDGAVALGHWQLERENDKPGGWFTLVLRKFPEGWRIIQDHTSSAPGK